MSKHEFKIKFNAWSSEGRGGKDPLDFEIFSRKGYFLSFERAKPNFATFAPP